MTTLSNSLITYGMHALVGLYILTAWYLFHRNREAIGSTRRAALATGSTEAFLHRVRG